MISVSGNGFNPPGQFMKLLFAEEAAERFAVTGLHPFVGDDIAEQAAWFQQPHAQLIEINIEVRHAVEDFVMGLQSRLEGSEQFLPDVGRVADDDIESSFAPSSY